MSLSILKLRHNRNMGKIRCVHLFFLFLVSNIFLWASDNPYFIKEIRVLAQWDFFKNNTQLVAISLPIKVSEKKPRDAGMNWSNIFFIRVIFS